MDTKLIIEIIVAIVTCLSIFFGGKFIYKKNKIKKQKSKETRQTLNGDGNIVSGRDTNIR